MHLTCARILVQVLEMNKRRKTMTKSEVDEISVTKMLLSVILVFLICNIVKIYVYVAGLYRTNSMVEHVADLLVMSNPSFNFIIYCFFNSQFRAQFLRMLGCQCIKKPLLKASSSYLTTMTCLHWILWVTNFQLRVDFQSAEWYFSSHCSILALILCPGAISFHVPSTLPNVPAHKYFAWYIYKYT